MDIRVGDIVRVRDERSFTAKEIEEYDSLIGFGEDIRRKICGVETRVENIYVHGVNGYYDGTPACCIYVNGYYVLNRALELVEKNYWNL